MVRLLTKALIMGGLILLTYVALWFVPVKPHVVYASIQDKHDRLAQMDSPRIIFVGGSGIALGLDSELVEHELGLAVVNMGVNAGFGLRYMLAEVQPAVRPGDVVVIAPEYEYFYGNSLEGSQNLLWALQIWGRDLLSRFDLSWGQLNTVARELPFFMQSRFLELLSSRQDPIYNRRAFNERGDFMNHLALPSLEIWPNSIAQGNSFNDEVLTLIDDFEDTAAMNGAKVYLLPPAIVESFYTYEDNQAEIDLVAKRIDEETSVALVAPPADYVLAADYFFDTVYHLNGAGRQLRTEMIVDDLAGHLQ